MDDVQVGALFRAVRRKMGLRQTDVGDMAGLSDSTVSLIERGRWRSLSFATVGQLAAVLGIRLGLEAWWRGGDANRLLSRAHSLFATDVARFLAELPGWTFDPEVSYSILGERGVLDELGWFAPFRHLLILEFKTEFVDVNASIGDADRRIRLAREIARCRGLDARMVSYWLIVADTRTNRRHASEHAALLRAKFPLDGRSLTKFLRNPSQPTFGMAFRPDSRRAGVGPPHGGGKSRIRIRRMSSEPESSSERLEVQHEGRHPAPAASR